MGGKLIISLDFELHWGVFDKMPWPESREYFLKTRDGIPKLLDLFAGFDIRATWATVGLLFAENRDEMLSFFPEGKPDYQNAALSAYYWIEGNGLGDDEKSDPAHFAFSLIKEISSCPGQEIGSHTFAHVFALEDGMKPEDYHDDLASARKIAKSKGFDVKSLVFPRNQYNRQILQAAFDSGFGIVRSNPDVWFWKPASGSSETLAQRVFRTGDAFLPLTSSNLHDESSAMVKDVSGLMLTPASRFLRPLSSNSFLNRRRNARIKAELTECAKKDLTYHLWWHPHNLAIRQDESFEALRDILAHVDSLKNEYGLKSLNMGELGI